MFTPQSRAEIGPGDHREVRGSISRCESVKLLVREDGPMTGARGGGSSQKSGTPPARSSNPAQTGSSPNWSPAEIREIMELTVGTPKVQHSYDDHSQTRNRIAGTGRTAEWPFPVR